MGSELMSFDRLKINKNMFAEPGDKVELGLYDSDNSNHSFIVPTVEVCQSIGLPLYSEVIGKYSGEVFDFDGKRYVIRWVIKPDVNSQFHGILNEMIDFLNEFYHFNFYGAFFTVYFGNYLSMYDNTISDDEYERNFISAPVIESLKEYIIDTVLGKNLNISEENDSRANKDQFFTFSYLKKGTEHIESAFYKDLARLLLNISYMEHTKSVLEDIDEFRMYCSYAKELYYLVQKVEYPFSDNIWNDTNLYICDKVFNKKYHHRTEICISQTSTDVAEFKYSNTLASSVEIPSNIKEIKQYAFSNSALHYIIFQSGGSDIIGANAFSNTKINSIIIPESTHIIREKAFYCCKLLKVVVVPETVERIESEAFAGCSSLEKVILLGNKTDIAPTAFNECDKLIFVSRYCLCENQNIDNNLMNIEDDCTTECKEEVYDIVQKPYQLKKNIDVCPYCNGSLSKKDCIYHDGKIMYKITLLYCDNCKCYYNNNLVENAVINVGIGKPTITKSNIWKIQNMGEYVALPIIPKSIVIINENNNETMHSCQLVYQNDVIRIEKNPAYNLRVVGVMINGDKENLPYKIVAKNLNNIAAAMTEYYIDFDFIASSLNVYCNDKFIGNNKLNNTYVTSGQIIRIEKADNFNDKLGRRVSKVMVNKKTVSLPYNCVVNESITISAEYTSSFFIFMDKRLSVFSSDKKYNFLDNSSSDYNRYSFIEPANIVIGERGGSRHIKKIKLKDIIYSLPANIRVDHQGVITVVETNETNNSTRLKKNSDIIIVKHYGQKLKNGDLLHPGDVLLISYIDNIGLDNKQLLYNGKTINPPCSITVSNTDINLELITRTPLKIYNTDSESCGSSSSDDMQLNTSSFLGDLGYSTQLGTSQRYEILQKAVRIYGKNKVIKFIEFLIRGKLGQVNGATKYQNAISIWRYDIERIRNM